MTRYEIIEDSAVGPRHSPDWHTHVVSVRESIEDAEHCVKLLNDIYDATIACGFSPRHRNARIRAIVY